MEFEDFASNRMDKISRSIKKLHSVRIDIKYIDFSDDYPNLKSISRFANNAIKFVSTVKYRPVYLWPADVFFSLEDLKKEASHLNDMEVNDLEKHIINNALDAFWSFMEVDYNRPNVKGEKNVSRSN